MLRKEEIHELIREIDFGAMVGVSQKKQLVDYMLDMILLLKNKERLHNGLGTDEDKNEICLYKFLLLAGYRYGVRETNLTWVQNAEDTIKRVKESTIERSVFDV